MIARSAQLAQVASLVSGAIVMAYWVAGLFFLRYWRDTRDRLFLVFAVAFWMLGLQRLLINLVDVAAEDQAAFYLLRLAAFLLIIWGVVEKNLGRNLSERAERSGLGVPPSGAQRDVTGR
jgi:hypothetical protein